MFILIIGSNTPQLAAEIAANDKFVLFFLTEQFAY